MLAKALAHKFESKLLLLDVSDFSMKVTMNKFQSFSLCSHWIVLILSILSLLQMQSKYGCSKKESVSFLLLVLMALICWVKLILIVYYLVRGLKIASHLHIFKYPEFFACFCSLSAGPFLGRHWNECPLCLDLSQSFLQRKKQGRYSQAHPSVCYPSALEIGFGWV